MITINGVQYRNLEEQVKKNKEDILYILEEEGVLNEFGIHVVNEVDSVDDLPDPTTYDGEFGDAYAVGTSAPYELYIYTRANGSHATNYWFNIGLFPLPGPAGPQGPQGEMGEKGLVALQDMGPRATYTVPLIGETLVTSATNFNRTPVVGDYFFQLVEGADETSVAGRSWITNNEITSSAGENYTYYIRGVMETTGAQGTQGIPGAVGPQGEQGPQGPIGPQGNPGQSFVIGGVVANEGQLPDPSTLDDNIAYLVGTQEPYDLYVQLQDTSEWVNAGILDGVQGPQGPQGPMPPLVGTRGNSTTDAISQQGIENIFYNAQVTLGVNSTVNSESTWGIAIGAESTLNGSTPGLAIGYNAYSVGENSVAIGNSARVLDGYGVAIGGGTVSDGSISIGHGSISNTLYSISIGQATRVQGKGTAVGACIRCMNGTAVGYNAQVNSRSVAIGENSSALGTSSVAVGDNCNVDGNFSVAVGQGINCNTDYVFQVGHFPLMDMYTGYIYPNRIQGASTLALSAAPQAFAAHSLSEPVQEETNANYFNRVIYYQDNAYTTFAYPYSANRNGEISLTNVSQDMSAIGATSVDTMLPASGMYNGGQVVGVYSVNESYDVNAVFTNGSSEVLSILGTVSVSA